MNETKLIKLCLKKDKKAWDIFIERYSKVVYWAVRKRVQSSNFQCDENDVEDIFQEVFLMVYKSDKLYQIKDPKIIPGWLSMVASNKTVDFMRQKVCWDRKRVINSEALKDCPIGQDLFDADTLAIIEEAINTLSNKERVIISLNLIKEKTHKEIADTLNIPENTVSTVIARTKQKLTIRLKEKGIEDFF